jgi:hypothetical protein
VVAIRNWLWKFLFSSNLEKEVMPFRDIGVIEGYLKSIENISNIIKKGDR